MATVKKYIGLLSQAGTAAPTAEVHLNSIGSIVWTRTGAGVYLGTLAAAFLVNNTHLLCSRSGAFKDISFERVSANVVQFTVKDDAGVAADLDGVGVYLEIKTYA